MVHKQSTSGDELRAINNKKHRIIERVYIKPQNKEDLIKRILFDISQSDFDKEEFLPVVELLQNIRDFEAVMN